MSLCREMIKKHAETRRNGGIDSSESSTGRSCGGSGSGRSVSSNSQLQRPLHAQMDIHSDARSEREREEEEEAKKTAQQIDGEQSAIKRGMREENRLEEMEKQADKKMCGGERK